ncbi:YggT family protein [Arthrobacter cryoconiti]|uniref:YggT family protein n=1 Tax=Arthrobacter cryoconiti TaxID=748907 RepID=A0ABV8R0H5_9MICC
MNTYVSIVFGLLYLLLLLYFLALMLRLVFDWIQVFARDWRPRGLALLGASIIYRLTDPPLRKLRALIPPLRIGNVSLDIGFLLLLVGVGIGMSVTRNLVV